MNENHFADHHLKSSVDIVRTIGEYGIANLINESAAAHILGLQVSTLRKWRVLGRGPVYRKPGGKSIRYSVSDLQEWINASKCGGGKH